MDCTIPPCTCPSTSSGLITLPQSSTATYLIIFVSPVSLSISTTQTWVPKGKVKFFGSKKYVADNPGSVSGGSSLATCAASAISWIVNLSRPLPGVGTSLSTPPGPSPTGTTGSEVPVAAAAAASCFV